MPRLWRRRQKEGAPAVPPEDSDASAERDETVEPLGEDVIGYLGRTAMVDGALATVVRVPERRTRGVRQDPALIVRGLLIDAGIIAVVLAIIWIGRAVGPPPPTYQWTFGVVPEYVPFLLQGLLLTLFLSVVSIGAGMLLGLFVAAAKLSNLPPLRIFITAYIEVMRGTPLLVQLVWAYYCLPIVTGLALPAVASVLVAMVLNMGAFYGESFRAGLQAIPKQERESASILGLSYFQQMRYILIPQTFRIILPVLISMSISLFKDTSLVAIVGLSDLMFNGLSASIATYRPLELLTTVGLIYFLVAFPATVLLRRFELHLLRQQ